MLATLAQLKLHMGISASTYDTVLEQILGQVDAHVKQLLNRNVESLARANEIYDGDCVYIQLKDRDLSESGFTFEYNAGDSETPDWTTVPRGDYELYYDLGVIAMNSVYGGRRSLRVSYTVGLADEDIPADLNMLDIRLASKIYNKRKSEGTSRESLEDVNFDWQNLLAPEDKDVIDNQKLKFVV